MARQNSRFLALAAMVGLGAFHAGAALAVPVVDQTHIQAATVAFAVVTTSQSVAQTFTVGLTGQLTSVDAYVNVEGLPPANLVLSILGTAAGLPTGSALTSVSLLPASVVGLTSFNFPDIAVTSGTVLAIVLASSSPADDLNRYLARPVSSAPVYSGGAFMTGSVGTFVIGGFDGYDLIFRTFVDQGNNEGQIGVPEPATLTLLAAGMVGLGVIARRRKRRSS